MRAKLSAVVITLNEQRVIRRCLESLAWADEIVVIDAGSSDRTEEIAKDPHASWAGKLTWFTREWTGFDDQRNETLEKSNYDWILSLDADERCTTELRDKILQVLSDVGSLSTQYFKVRRQEYFLGKEINWGVWNPSYQDRFFHKEGVRYVNKVHEYPVYPKEPKRIHECIEHDPEFNPQRFLSKMVKYTSIEAKDRVDSGRRTNAFRIFFAFFAMFWKNYFYYKSYRDGYYGFVISVLEGISRAVRHIRMWEYQNHSAE